MCLYGQGPTSLRTPALMVYSAKRCASTNRDREKNYRTQQIMQNEISQRKNEFEENKVTNHIAQNLNTWQVDKLLPWQSQGT